MKKQTAEQLLASSGLTTTDLRDLLHNRRRLPAEEEGLLFRRAEDSLD